MATPPVAMADDLSAMAGLSTVASSAFAVGGFILAVGQQTACFQTFVVLSSRTSASAPSDSHFRLKVDKGNPWSVSLCCAARGRRCGQIAEQQDYNNRGRQHHAATRMRHAHHGQLGLTFQTVSR